MSLNTAKWGLTYPQETDADDVPVWLQTIAAQLDTLITGWHAPDTWANRPQGAAITDGLFFWATDQGQFYVGQGGVLRPITVTYGASGDITTAAFGDTPSAGATGRVADAGHRHGQPANPITAHVAAGDPHPAYALDTDFAPRDAAQTEFLVQQWMTPGAPANAMRRVGPVAVASTSTAAMTPILPAVAANTKAIIKSLIVTNTSAVTTSFKLSSNANWTAGQFATDILVQPGDTIEVDLAMVLVAGQGLFASASVAGNINITVSYVTLNTTLSPQNLPQQYSFATGLNGTAGATTLITPAAPIMVTSILVANVSTIDSILRLGLIGFGSVSDILVPANSWTHLGFPIYLPVGTNLNAQNLSPNNLSWLSITASGFAALS